MNKIYQIIISILAILGIGGGGGAYIADQLGNANTLRVSKMESATSSISNCKRSIDAIEPTTTDPSVGGGDMPWTCSTTTGSGTPDWIRIGDNVGFVLSIAAENVGHAVRFWFPPTTTDMTVGGNSTGFLIKAGESWKSEDYGINYEGKIYTYASTTTSTLQYILLKNQ